jgi:hypothetical protein
MKTISSLYRRIHLGLMRRSETSCQAAATSGKPLFVMSLHKSGSHLLKNVLNALGYETFFIPGAPNLESAKHAPANAYLSTVHRLPCDDVRCACARGEVKIVLNVRDPRDIFLSTIDYFDWTRKETAFEHVNFYRTAYRYAFKDRHELALAILNSRTLGDYPYTLQNQFESCLVLYFHPSVLAVKYEALLPAPCDSRSTQETKRICDYLEIDYPPAIESIAINAVARGSRTFNVAKTQRWKTELEPELLEMFMEKHGHVVRALGYD